MDLTIAIADSSPVMRRWLQMAIAPLGGAVMEASDGVELLDIVGEVGPLDVVVANRVLPMISGEQVLTMMRTAGDHTPFILIAPFCRESVRALVHNLGCAALVDDPLDGAELLHVAKTFVDESIRLSPKMLRSPKWNHGVPRVGVAASLA